MNFKQLVRDYFTFSRNERKGITILLILIFLLAIANRVVFMFETPAKIDAILLDSARKVLGPINDSIIRKQDGMKLFTFNPNTIDSTSLDTLDLPINVKRNLLKFRNKGGKFFSSEDFRKIYGVTDLVFNQVSPYLQFDQSEATFRIERRKLKPEAKPERFNFDPNAISDSDFIRLGLSTKQITTIRNYQSKGGTFRKKEDFFRIYGLTDYQKTSLESYIVIEKDEKISSGEKAFVQNSKVEINSADSTQLMQLPGIGEKLSKRIIKYRDLLGGYSSPAQLKEVYGLKDETYHLIENQISVDVSKIKKLDLNFGEVKELSRHPYLKKMLAGQIVKFRTKYGSIHDLSVLRDSMILNIDEYVRLKPYF